MIEAHIRSKMQPFFDTIGKIVFIPFAIAPNTITLLAFITGLCSSMCICINQLIPALFMLLLSGLCDIMDGTVARITQQSQKIGAYIDLLSDRMVEAAIIFGFTIAYPQHYLAYIIFLIAVLLHFSTFTVAGALFANTGQKSMHYDRSMVERAEAFIVFAMMLLLPEYIFPILLIFSCIVLVDGIARFFRIVTYERHNKG